MDVEGILSELKKQRRRINRAIAVVEMLKPPRQWKRNRRKLTSPIELSRPVHILSKTQEKSAPRKSGRSRARVIPFALRRRA